MKPTQKKPTYNRVDLRTDADRKRLFNTAANMDGLNDSNEEDDVLDTDEDRVMIHHPGQVTKEERRLLWQRSEDYK